jgi:hypothetical protein
MVTVFQHTGFMTDKRLARRRYLGSFFSRESAEKKLGWFYIAEFCDVEPF